MPGGCIHESFRVQVHGRTRFLKTNEASFDAVFAAEADGLHALRAAGVRAPEPLTNGTAGGKAFLLLEWLDLGKAGDFAALGLTLAELHRHSGPAFGWRRDNYIGATAQRNGWCDGWSEFWHDRRLKPQLQLAEQKGYRLDRALFARACAVLRGHAPAPSLVHGDLWSGNAAFTPHGPVLFDPAVYYGDREVDLAMTELFGGFPKEFYAAYQQAFPLLAGYETRKILYNL
ncbi:MAG TPA: fructosamine kinase family protein, partial [Burkholderiales bacterium]